MQKPVDPLDDKRNTGKGRSLGDTILADLIRRLEKDEWAPGSRLPSVRALTREYDVTPLTMSRVIRRLAQLGHVTTVPGKGIYARQRVEADLPKEIESYEWQQGLFRRRPFRTFGVSLPQGMPLDTINLGSGTMSHLAVPIDSVRAALTKVASNYEESPIAQRSPLGELALREWLRPYLAQSGINARVENVLVVTSIHQALRLLAFSIIDSGDSVLIESPSDPIVIGVLDSLGARCIGVPVDEQGMNVEVAAELVQRFRPKMIVTSPTGQVPTGVTMPAQRRKQLVEMAALNRTLIVEYDLSAEIYFGSPPPMPLKSWDRHGCVVYVREFSRITAAGFRIGCMTVEGPLFQRLAESKRRDDFIISTIAQSAFLSYVTSKHFPRNIVKAREYYAVRRDAALGALQRTMPPSIKWFTPASGFHIWVSLPPALSARSLVNEAALRGVIVAPSDVFSIDGKLEDGIRITFSDNSPEEIERGIGRLADAAHVLLQRGVSLEPARVFEIV